MSSGFDTCLALLTQGETPTVWSLIVTIFGDMAQGEGQTLTTPMLTGLTAMLGIKSQATRVALHRLKSDGWLWSKRDGRSSRFGLTAHGRAQSFSASPRIYARHSNSGEWVTCVAAPAARETLTLLIEQGRAHLVAPGVVIAREAPPQTELLCIQGSAECPDWVSQALCPPELQAASAGLLARLSALGDALPPSLNENEAAALRVLIVHEWRRVILRAPDLPAQLFPTGWKGDACRTEVHRLLDRIAALQSCEDHAPSEI